MFKEFIRDFYGRIPTVQELYFGFENEARDSRNSFRNIPKVFI